MNNTVSLNLGLMIFKIRKFSQELEFKLSFKINYTKMDFQLQKMILFDFKEKIVHNLVPFSYNLMNL